MERYSAVRQQLNRNPQTISMQNWVENYICGTQADQKVVGNRCDNLNLPVTQLMFDRKNRWAHVCPYVIDAIDYDHCWIEESDLDGSRPQDIEMLLLQQLQDFKKTPPAHDPVLQGPAPLPALWKTFITFFPRITRESRTGPFPLIDEMYLRLLPVFVLEGMMFGEFYPGCPSKGIYNDQWPKSFVCPFTAFVMRYMARHDHLFITRGTPIWDAYKSFFPQEAGANQETSL